MKASHDIDGLCVNALRFLAVDAVEKAKSGHPGMPLGAAPMAYVLWGRFLRHNPRNPAWFNRDRFVLSAGHGSALLYALLHMTGYDLPLDQLRQFRQWGSITPGHPEHGLTLGVEATTGPLGQGFAMGVGMAIAERFLAVRLNRPGFPVVDHYTYAIVSDGDLMEGISSEAASLAGTLGLGKLIYLYDDNGISIEGPTALTFREDVGARFTAYGWRVRHVSDGNDLDALEQAIQDARKDLKRPSLIVVSTHIGYGSPKQDSAESHGEPLGPDAVRATKQALGWPIEPDFYIPEEALTHMREALDRGARLEADWRDLVDRNRRDHEVEGHLLEAVTQGLLPAGWDRDLPAFAPSDGPVATRDASGRIMNALAESLPNLIGGSADLAPSTKTLLKASSDFGPGIDDPKARNLHFGVREHAMGAIVNGMALHGGVIPYGSTFLVFSDYMRPALRFAAMMQTPAIFIFSHDSVALGEDGPTHQPIEHLMSLRTIPGLTVIRPADANETVAAWRLALARGKPVALILTRQKIPILDPRIYPVAEGVQRGAYLLEPLTGKTQAGPLPDIILIATGSEVHLALAASQILKDRGVRARVVSMPSWEIFEEQPAGYRGAVLPPGMPKLAIEAGATLGWYKYVGENGSDKGDVIGLDRFGASAPGEIAYEKLGFTVDNVVQRAMRLIGRPT
ncbi:MAG: transketolase [Candidatus Eisenbacteria bacterium]